jgi:hypothetical protein
VVAYGLEVAADEQEVDCEPAGLLEGCDARVDLVECAVAAAFDGDLKEKRGRVLRWFWIYGLSAYFHHHFS